MSATVTAVYPSYAVAVSIGGTTVPAGAVVCDLTVRSGRSRQDDGISAASATVELLEADPGGIVIETAGVLRITVDGLPRFTGRISEVTRTPLRGGGATWTLVAVGHLRRLASFLVALPLPAESAALRAQRAITGPGFIADIRGGSGYQMAAVGVAGDAPISAESVLSDVVTATGAVPQDLGDGSIMVQFEDARLSEDQWTPDPIATSTDLAFAQADDVVNSVVVEYAGGSRSASDPGSIAKYDQRGYSVRTALADAGSATQRASSLVGRLAWPAWSIETVQTWDPEFYEHELGALVTISPLPAGSPVEDPWQGVLEGWVEHYQPAPDGSAAVFGVFILAIGDRAHSAETVVWSHVTPTLTWAGVDPATAWNEAISNAALTP